LNASMRPSIVDHDDRIDGGIQQRPEIGAIGR
jgi:hypothetical protein